MNDSNRRDIHLDKNESYYFLNSEILEEIKSFDESVITTYPNIQKLKQIIADNVGHPIENILPCHGSEQSIRLSIMTLLTPGEKVILLSPTFVAFDYALEYFGVEPMVITYEEKNGHFYAPVETILSSLGVGVKCIMICNPSNPLGCAISKSDMLKIIEKANEYDILVIVDEVYSKFSGVTCSELVNEFDNLIIFKSFSKEYGLAGVRLGYAIASPSIVKKLDDARRMFWPISHFAVHTLKVVLKHSEYFNGQIESAKQRRDRIISTLRGLGLNCYSSETNFFIARSERWREILDYLASNGIYLGEVGYFKHGEHLLEKAFRISIPSPEDEAELIKRFSILKEKGLI